MDIFSALMAVIGLISAASAGSNNGAPDLPGYTPPDYGPLEEQNKFTTYQDKTRNELLKNFYGATMDGGRPSFGGDKPAAQYREAQTNILNDSEAGFGSGLSDYFAARGVNPGDQVQGAQQELGTTYDQRAREINAKSHDIYALTLGNLFGEVSDAGQQSAQLTANIGMANQTENNRRDQSYQQAMARWQYEQSQPTTLGTIGAMLPYLATLYNGGTGGSSPYYNAANYPSNYAAGSGGSAYTPPGYANPGYSWPKY